MNQEEIAFEAKTRWEETEEHARAFHQSHPDVWHLFCHYSHKIRKAGYQNYSAMAVMQRIQWHKDAGSNGTTQFKINNNYIPHYARWFMAVYPDFDGFFRTRHPISMDMDATNLPELTPYDFEALL